MHANVSLWKAKSQDGLEKLLQKAEADLLPKLQAQAGFIKFEAIVADKDTLILVHTWQSKEQADKGVRSLGPWLLVNAATKVSPISRHSGDVVLSTSSGE